MQYPDRTGKEGKEIFMGDLHLADTGKDELKEGTKYDGGKLRYDLIDAYALEQLAAVYTFGAKKYEDDNWRKE
jgi:hypothetical protein